MIFWIKMQITGRKPQDYIRSIKVRKSVIRQTPFTCGYQVEEVRKQEMVLYVLARKHIRKLIISAGRGK